MLWLTCLLTMIAYYLIVTLREARNTVLEVKQKLSAVESFIRHVSSKVEHTTSSFQLLMEGFSRITTFLQDRKSSPRTRRKTE